MQSSITLDAPAKINIGLRVFPKREDGYHNIKSIFKSVSLCDSLTVSLLPEKDTCIVECQQMLLPKDNTFTKAYKAFCVLTGIHEGVSVKVNKRIPSGGGLGGGSSDASSFIQSVDELLGTRLRNEDFANIASHVGSDVFFFAHAKGQVGYTALVEGRGERVKELAIQRDFAVLLLLPGLAVLTKEAYALVDSWQEKEEDTFTDWGSEYKKIASAWSFKNDFTLPVQSKYNRIKIALDTLKSAGADFADMSGSGSTVFGVFENRKHAIEVQNRIGADWQAFLV